MNRFFSQLLFFLLVLSGNLAYSQYQEKQIDSILDASTQANALSRVTIAYNAAKKISYDKGIVEALILFSKSSYAAGRYDESFKYITQAESASGKVTDPVVIYNIRTFKGLCYGELGFYKEEDQLLHSAIPVAKRISNKDEMHYYLSSLYGSLAINCDHMHDTKAKAIWDDRCYNESIPLGNSRKYSWSAAIEAANRGYRFIQRRQYDSAAYYLNEAVLDTKNCSDSYQYKKTYAQYVCDLDLGRLYYEQKKFTTSAFYLSESANAASRIYYSIGRKRAYAALAKTYTSLNRPADALRVLQISNKIGDSLAQANKAAIKTPLDYIVNSKEKEIAKARIRFERIILLVFVVLFIIACSVIFYRRKLKGEINLSAEKVKELMKKIELKENAHSPERIAELQRVVQLAVDNDPAFFIKFNEFDSEFAKKLLAINPNLIATEIEFCAMLRLNFETKEIARYAKISVRAVEGKKYRLRKKLNIESDQDINTWMTQL